MRGFLSAICAILVGLSPVQAFAWGNPLPGLWGGVSSHNLTVFASPSTATFAYPSSGTYTTNPVSAVANGGSPPYTYHWALVSGSSTPTVDSANTATTTWTAAVTSPNTYTASWRMTVTDMLSNTATTSVPVSFTPATSTLTVALAPSSALATYSSSGSQTTNSVAATASGGVPPYTYGWSYVSGDAPPTGPDADSPTSATTTWTANVPTPSTTYTATWNLTVTDFVSATASATTPVNFTPVASPSFPLDVLARGIVADNVLQTSIQNPSGQAATAFFPKPKVIYTNLDAYSTTYSSGTGNVTMKLATPPSIPLAVGSTIKVTGVSGTGTDIGLVSGTFTAVTGTTSSIAVYSVGTGKNITGITAAQFVTPDIQNFVDAGITFVRIPIDVQTILQGLPYPTSYLQPPKVSSASYTSGTGVVTMTLPSSFNTGPTQTTSSGTYAATKTITVASTAGLWSGVKLTDITNPTAIVANTTIDTISGTTIVLSAATSVTGVQSGDVLTASPVTLSNTAAAGVNGPTANGAAANTTSVVVSSAAGLTVGSTVTDLTAPTGIANGTTIAAINTSTKTLTLSQKTTASPGVGNLDQLVFNDSFLLSGSFPFGAGTSGTHATYVPTSFPKAVGAVSGVNTITVSSASGLATGMTITDQTSPGGIPGGTTITGLSGTTVTLSANVTVANNDVFSIVATGLHVGAITTVPVVAGLWVSLPSNLTQSAGLPGGCAATYVSTSCVNNWQLVYLDEVVAQFVAKGIAVDLVPFVAGVLPQNSQISGATSQSTSGDLHEDMGLSAPCYTNTATGNPYPAVSTLGGTCFEGMLAAANVVLANRYALGIGGALPIYTPHQVFFEVYNEADYKATGQAQGPWQLYTIWTNPTDGGAMQEISNDIRAVTSTHWIIQDGISAAKAQWFPPNISTGYLGITPTTDTQTVYSFHKYDPAAFVDEGDGNPSNPLLIYPVPSHNDFAIGRPGNTALAFLPPVPVFGTPAWQTTVDASGSCAGAAWVQSPTPLTGSGQQKACVKPGGGANATLTDFYTPATNSTDFGNANVNREYTKAELLNNISTGINLVVGWAAAGGHGSGPLAAVPMKIMAGEIGQTSYIIDYLSRLQFTTDIMNVLETTGVPGGQSSIPWDQWAFSGAKLGIKPKGGGDPGYTGAGLTHNNFCLNANPADPLFGYDIDYWARIKTVSGVHPTPNPNPACDTSTGPNYGTPGL